MANVLIMDDEPDLREIWAEVLIGAGHQVHTAPNAIEGMKLIGLHSFDIVLLDLNMPRMSGLEMLKRLRSIEADLPIVVITGIADPSINRAIREAGASGVFGKPISLKELTGIVSQFARQPEE
jgi:CheY-like chemotaxis protein